MITYGYELSTADSDGFNENGDSGTRKRHERESSLNSSEYLDEELVKAEPLDR